MSNINLNHTTAQMILSDEVRLILLSEAVGMLDTMTMTMMSFSMEGATRHMPHATCRMTGANIINALLPPRISSYSGTACCPEAPVVELQLAPL